MIWINGQFAEDDAPLLTAHDSGLVGAIGVFDSMLAVDGIPQYPQEHFARLLHDAEIVIQKTPRETSGELMEITQSLLKKSGMTGYIRIRSVITAGPVSAPLGKAEKLTLMISVGPSVAPRDIAPAKAVIIRDYPRIAGCELENCKRLDYTRSYAARRKAETRGGDEAILTNTNGHIACGATSNIFIEENGVLITPPLRDGVLDGITRRHILAERGGREESISAERLLAADGVFLTNSFVGLRKSIIIN